ncbi:MAG: ABC transporter permease [Bacillota bacterium]|nr:ABC transporter permease [Bacillota bacterium]
MLKYFIKRIGYMIFVFLVMSVLLFWLYSLIPGDPAKTELEPLRETLTPEEYQLQYKLIRDRLGLDDPIYVRYARWAQKFFTGDFGISNTHKKPVADVVKEPLKITILYNLVVLTFIFIVTVPLGIICAIKKNSAFDKVVQILTVVGYSIPSFVFALLFISFFAVHLGWFPVSGMKTPNFQGTNWEAFLDLAKHMALPIIVLTVSSLGGMTRYVRAQMTDALSMDCIRTARAKGLKESVVVLVHAWRNALLGLITIMISFFMSMFSGALILESMFLINGMGKFLYDALLQQDYNVTIALQLFYVVIALVTNLIVDLSYGLVDPRVRVNK